MDNPWYSVFPLRNMHSCQPKEHRPPPRGFLLQLQQLPLGSCMTNADSKDQGYHCGSFVRLHKSSLVRAACVRTQLDDADMSPLLLLLLLVGAPRKMCREASRRIQNRGLLQIQEMSLQSHEGEEDWGIHLQSPNWRLRHFRLDRSASQTATAMTTRSLV